MGLFDAFKKDKNNASQRSKYLRRFELCLQKCASDEELFNDIQQTFSRFEHLSEISSKLAKEIDSQIYTNIDSLFEAMQTSKSEARAQRVHKLLFNIDNLMQQRKTLSRDFDESPKEDFVIEDKVLTSYVGNGGDVVVPIEVEAIGEKAFYHNQSVRSIILQEGVKEIKEEAFYLCKGLNYVKLPSTLNHIGQSAFYACKALEKVDVQNGLIAIDYYAFAKCESLKKITIPRTCKKIKDKAFGDCTSLDKDAKKAIKDINKKALEH